MKTAIISDIHEDVESLKKVLLLIEKEKCDDIIFLGDIVGFADKFYPFGNTKNANECLSLIKNNCKLSIIGNHDLYITKRFPDLYKERNFPTNWYDLTIEEQKKISDNNVWLYEEEEDPVIDDENMNFLKSVPTYHFLEFENFKCLFSHFIKPDISGVSKFFPTEKKSYSSHFKFMAENNCAISFVGHAHIDGYAVVYKNKTSYKPFCRNKKLKNKSQIIICPAIAQSSRKSGFVIFDSNAFEISVINI